jgi:hypothetical protein
MADQCGEQRVPLNGLIASDQEIKVASGYLQFSMQGVIQSSLTDFVNRYFSTRIFQNRSTERTKNRLNSLIQLTLHQLFAAKTAN